MGGGERRVGMRARIAVGVLGGVLVLLVLAQLVLPRVAARVVRDRVGRYGEVESATVHAFPAIELLWGSADSVKVTARSLKLSVAQTAELLSKARPLGNVDISVSELREGILKLDRASFRKRGSSLSAEGDLEEGDLNGVLPAGVKIQPVSSSEGKVEVRASGGLFGVETTVPAVVEAQEGVLVAEPEGLPLHITLFSDPRVRVEGVGYTALGGGSGGEAGAGAGAGTETGYRLRVTGTLR